jgi:hypothetical protein
MVRFLIEIVAHLYQYSFFRQGVQVGQTLYFSGSIELDSKTSRLLETVHKNMLIKRIYHVIHIFIPIEGSIFPFLYQSAVDIDGLYRVVSLIFISKMASDINY